MADSITIMKRLNADFEQVTAAGYVVLGVFLFGSQNYGTDTATSDIDTKAIVIPNMNQALFAAPISKTMKAADGSGEITVKDIRDMHRNLEKQGYNFLEILFTPYRVLSPWLGDMYRPIFEHAEEIARMDATAAIRAILGQMSSMKRLAFTRTDATAAEYDQYGFVPKKLANFIFNYNLLLNYIAGKPFAMCLEPTDRAFIVQLKTDCILDADQAKQMMDLLDNTAMVKTQEFLNNYTVDEDRKSYLHGLLKGTAFRIIEKQFANEIAMRSNAN